MSPPCRDADCARALRRPPSKTKRAQEMPDARCTRSRVCRDSGVAHTRCQVTPENARHSPRNGFNGFLRALPGDRACLPPSSADCSANLTPASGRQDHTTSPYAAASFVRAHFARLTPQRPPHPAPYVRDDREAPLLWERDDESSRDDLGRRKSEIFLRRGLDRLMGDLPVGQIRAT